MIEKAPVFYMARKSRFGIFAIVWRDYYGQPKIKRVLISKPGLSAYDKVGKEYPGIKESECGEIKKVAECMDSFFEGGAVSFPLDVTLIERCTDFQKKVLRAEHGIPRGCVSTYKKIAEHLEKPGGARAVGTALATNPFPIIIPCHRAIRTDGTLGGYQGGLEMKKRLLEMEGVSVGENGCVLTDKYFY
jgi:methylated-DNA-[protein]-cysteine S-methyltransferase